jgi:GH25 family lysozyme M1 (1,4-beta-N-acetylmuramidase)
VILYANRNCWLNVDTTSYAGDGLWIADYVSAGKPRIQAKWRFHQYTDDPVDTNVADFSSRAALKEWAQGA